MSEKKAYVGNLSYNTTEETLRTYFGENHPVSQVNLIKDRDTGRSKGFAFVTFETQEGLDEALSKNGQDLDGRPLRVNVAEDKRR